MKKQIYQSPRAWAYNIIGKTMISESMKIGGSDEKVGDSGDIGFAKEQQSQGDRNLWNEEW